ncbi:MAG: radical SAM protein [Gammaproteobacteria bacterium]|nr:radical SAM protein [Gammaproteobacteria bacterium]
MKRVNKVMFQGSTKAIKLRLLLTNRCTASCDYCHNEGQDKQAARSRLSLQTIRDILDNLAAAGQRLDEIVLSGGEPTLHSQLSEVAALCRVHTDHLSMDSHLGHPKLLAAALPHLDELKIHLDSFDAAEQQRSMGIALAPVLESIDLAQKFPIQLCINHPFMAVESTRHFIRKSAALGINCKIIELFEDERSVPLAALQLERMGYRWQRDGVWSNAAGHQLFTKRCGAEHNVDHGSLFVGADGIRYAVDGPVVGDAERFAEFLAPSAQGVLDRCEAA